MNETVVLVAVGASTPVGRSAPASAAAVRAGITGFAQHPYLVDTVGEPVHAAIAPWLDIALTGADRLEALLFPAIDEALAVLRKAGEPGGKAMSMAIALGLASPRPGVPNNLQSTMKARLREKFGAQFSSAACFPAGHAASLLALDAAISKLRQGTLQACMVAGVDSYIDAQALEWLESSDQLHGAGHLNNAWGLLPGEGAGALLLMTATTAKRLGLPALAMLLGAGLAQEQKCIKTDTVCIGEGLTSALKVALAALPRQAKVSDIYCDMNGEPYRADEFGFAALRTKAHFESAGDFLAPADCWGDVAAAGGALHVMLAAAAINKGYARGPHALVWASSEGGDRAAVLLSAAPSGG
jgi:3-oxoacyl-[acyl-carrier-protein] synthase-1